MLTDRVTSITYNQIKHRWRILVICGSIIGIPLILLSKAIFPNILAMQYLLLVLITVASLVFSLVMFNRYIWRWGVWRWLGIINIPYLGGTWKGNLTSSHTDHSELHPVTVTIQHRWMGIIVNLRGRDAGSESISATIVRDENGGYSLCYIYQAIPDDPTNPIYESHRGMGILTLRDSNTLSGFYEYYDRRRQHGTHGQLYLER